MYNENILNKVNKIHFIGIGGSGMYPIAEILKTKGYQISGSDIYESDTLERVKSLGINVSLEHKKENINNAELVVYSAAIKNDNPEILAAKEQNIPTVERSVMLGMLSKQYKNSIAVSGTHGKTSTTAMITQILIDANIDPTAIIGGTLPAIGGNSHTGNSQTLVCEACEYVDTFLQLSPAIAVILNIDEDHLDYFKNLENIKNSFRKFAKQTTNTLVINGDDRNTTDAINGLKINTISFGLNESNDYYAVNINTNHGIQSSYDLMHKGKKLANIKLNVPGKHNIYNSLAAISTCHSLNVPIETIKTSIEKFSGVHRRFEILGKPGNIVVADDFAHHPTELKAVLSSAMGMGFNNVWAVFQPHTFSRTYMLLNDFAKALSIADHVVISEILPVRETNKYNISSKDLGSKIDNCVCIDTFSEIADYIEHKAQTGDLVLTIGGGNVYRCANLILEKLQKKYS